VQAFVDEMLVIPDSEILEGMRVLMERCKLYVEPSAGAAVAPLLTERLRVPRAARVVPVICGGNIALDRLKTLF
jgi:threonine dehydratase